MITLYVIKSLRNKFRYVGITNDLGKRLHDHNKGYNKSTKPYRPLRLIHTEEFRSHKEARVREKFFKSGAGRKILDDIEIA